MLTEHLLKVTSGEVPDCAKRHDRLPASDHAPMSYELKRPNASDDSTDIKVAVYNVCWEIFEPKKAMSVPYDPSARILAHPKIAHTCSENVLSNVTELCRTHALVLLQEVPMECSGPPGDEAVEAWMKITTALDNIETHTYIKMHF